MNRFIHQHEMSRRLRMGHGDGASVDDLFLEDAQHAPGTPRSSGHCWNKSCDLKIPRFRGIEILYNNVCLTMNPSLEARIQNFHPALDADIDLGEFFRIAIKRKSLIITLVAVALCSATLATASLQETFEVSMVIQPPATGFVSTDNSSGAIIPFHFLDTAENLKARIEEGAYNATLVNQLNLGNRKFQIHVSQKKDANVMRVYLLASQRETALCLSILQALQGAIEQSYETFTGQERAQIGSEIKLLKSGIQIIQNTIKTKERLYGILEERARQLSSELKDTKDNSAKLLSQRDALLNQKGGNDQVSSLLYTATLQQNIAYFTQLQNEFSDLRSKQENLLIEIDALREKIGGNEVEISNRNLLKDSIQSLVVIQRPLVYPQPIGLHKLRIIVTAGVLALMVGVFWAFIDERSSRV